MEGEASIERRRLVARWVHSHEEDDDSSTVLRPADHELPPSRGRTRLELREDGRMVEDGPGPDDRLVEATGAWELKRGEVLILRGPDGDRAQRVLAAEPDRLVLAK